jgi:hypothetical protein
MKTRAAQKILHFFDRKRLLQRKWLRFLALEKTHSIFRSYAELTDLIVSGKRVAGSMKALIKVTVQNTELSSFGFVVRKQRHADPRHPLQQLFDLLKHEGQWLRVQDGDNEATVRSAINGVLDARSYHVRLHDGPSFPLSWSGLQLLNAILESELQPAGFALAQLNNPEGGFGGTVIQSGNERRIAALLEQIRTT